MKQLITILVLITALYSCKTEAKKEVEAIETTVQK
jgi:hypothetical protein